MREVQSITGCTSLYCAHMVHFKGAGVARYPHLSTMTSHPHICRPRLFHHFTGALETCTKYKHLPLLLRGSKE